MSFSCLNIVMPDTRETMEKPTPIPMKETLGTSFIRPEAAKELAHPLDAFYARHHAVLPPLETIEGQEVPEPYRGLLVHPNDMTSTLEEFHHGTIEVEVLSRSLHDDEYFREVMLKVSDTGKVVEFGAIRIHLCRFPEAARQQVLEEHWPLGHILKEHAIPFTSQPKAFLRLASDPLINRVFHLEGARVLYGRRNTLYDPASGESLAEIVEILPPE